MKEAADHNIKKRDWRWNWRLILIIFCLFNVFYSLSIFNTFSVWIIYFYLVSKCLLCFIDWSDLFALFLLFIVFSLSFIIDVFSFVFLALLIAVNTKQNQWKYIDKNARKHKKEWRESEYLRLLLMFNLIDPFNWI